VLLKNTLFDKLIIYFVKFLEVHYEQLMQFDVALCKQRI